jgi:putative sterol carrier protein
MSMGTATAAQGYLDSHPGPSSKEREMPQSVQEFFQNLESQADASKTAGMTNSYVFDIDGAGQWKVDVDDGKVTVTEGGGDADAVISATEETFQKIVAGEQNPTSAYMTGKLKIKGDMGAAMKLQKLF